MQIYKDIIDYRSDAPYRVATIGNFDGVHLGHQSILLKAVKDARKNNGETLLVTFSPHPAQVLNPTLKINLLQTEAQFFSSVENNNLDTLIVEPFSKEYASQSAEEFFHRIYNQLKFNKLFVGYDFKFGKDKVGDFEFLKNKSQQLGFELEKISPFKIGETVISSSLIRSRIMNGRIEDANNYLGHNYKVSGVVEHGEGKGAQLGFPTLNIASDNDLFLKLGVYHTEVTVMGEKYNSITNFGLAPTVKNEQLPVLETHILNNNLQAYGEKVELSFIKFVRPEKKFSGVDELVQQIKSDIAFIS